MILGPLPVSDDLGFPTGQVVYIDTGARLASADPGFTTTRPLTAAEARDVDQAAADNAANQAAVLAEQARADALAALAAPITPPTVTGTTVAGVKASADAAVKALAQEFSDRLAALPDALGG